LKRKNKVGIIIEARSTSSRLPNKHFYKINNKTILEYLIKRVKKVTGVKNIIIATTTNQQDDKICNLAIKNKIDFYRGSENNVTQRVLRSAEKFKIDIICEITGDCPIIDIELVSQLIATFKSNFGLIDYATNSNGLPNGMGCQVFKTSILKKSYSQSKKNLEEQEHVTLNIRRNPKKYRLFDLRLSKNYQWPELEVTLDELVDFKLLKKIILYFEKKKNFYFNCLDVIDLLRNKKKSWIKINKGVFRKDDTIIV